MCTLNTFYEFYKQVQVNFLSIRNVLKSWYNHYYSKLGKRMIFSRYKLNSSESTLTFTILGILSPTLFNGYLKDINVTMNHQFSDNTRMYVCAYER